MEGKVTELLDRELFEGENATEELLVNEKLNELIPENLISKKTVEELTKDEEILTSYLNKLKKDNFKLETTVKAWKITFNNKLEELKEAESKLDDVYNEIQSERENFCSKLDKFNNEYGILSSWWEKQMNVVSQLENPEGETSGEEKCKEVKQLEKDIEDLKKEIEVLKAEKEEVRLSQEGKSFVRSQDEEVSPKKLKVSEEKDEDDKIISNGKESKTSQAFYSFVNVERVRMANKRRNQRRDMF